MLRYAKIISKQCVCTYPSSLHNQPLNTCDTTSTSQTQTQRWKHLPMGPQLVGRTRSLSWATRLWMQTLIQGASQALLNKDCRLDKIETSKDARSSRVLFFPGRGSTSSNHTFNFSMLFKFSLMALSTYITLRGGLDYLWRMRGKENYLCYTVEESLGSWDRPIDQI